MKSITIHALDDQLAKALKHRAGELSVSMNELMKKLLAEGLGLKVPVTPPHRGDFTDFCGTWTEKESLEFKARLGDTTKVDPKDWK